MIFIWINRRKFLLLLLDAALFMRNERDAICFSICTKLFENKAETICLFSIIVVLLDDICMMHELDVSEHLLKHNVVRT